MHTQFNKTGYAFDSSEVISDIRTDGRDTDEATTELLVGWSQSVQKCHQLLVAEVGKLAVDPRGALDKENQSLLVLPDRGLGITTTTEMGAERIPDRPVVAGAFGSAC